MLERFAKGYHKQFHMSAEEPYTSKDVCFTTHHYKHNRLIQLVSKSVYTDEKSYPQK